MQCEAHYGGAWYYAPGRWPTDDGFVPYRLLWIYWRAMQSTHAIDALSTARGIGLALGDGEAGAEARRRTLRDAYPAS